MKTLIKQLRHSIGARVPYPFQGAAGSNRRPIGSIQAFLDDIKARHFNPAFVLDVGAHRGEWARMAKTVFPEARFLLIEPQPEMRESLNQLCSDFPDMTWVEAGAGSQPGKLVQTIWKDLAGSSFLPPVQEKHLQSGKQREVDIVTIDALLAAHPSGIPDLVKLDIQGFELEALRGAGSLFGQTELFIMEVNLFSFMPDMPVVRDVVQFMGDRGYDLYDIPGYLRRPCDGALGQVDLAFAKRDGQLRQTHRW